MTSTIDLPAAASPTADPATSVYRRRQFALGITTWGFVVSMLWLGGPMAFVVAFFLVGGGNVPLFAAVWVIGIGLIFGLAGVPLVLHSLERLRIATGDPVLLKVGPEGLWLRDVGHLGWWQIKGIRIGSVDIVRQRYDYRQGLRLEIVPIDASHLARRPWFVAADQGLRGLIRRFKPAGDRSVLQAGFQLDLDLLEGDPRGIVAEIERYRADVNEAGLVR